MKTNLKILMAMDGSEQSLNAVRYLGEAFPAEGTQVVLINVKATVPESFFDIRKDEGFRSAMVSISAWDAHTRKEMETFMVRAKAELMEAGFPDNRVITRIHAKRAGIARDILLESYSGYHAVVVGRTGTSKIKDFVLGSVANKIVGKIPHLPVVVEGV